MAHKIPMKFPTDDNFVASKEPAVPTIKWVTGETIPYQGVPGGLSGPCGDYPHEEGAQKLEAVAEEVPWVAMHTHAKIDTFVADEKLELPETWADLTVADKKAWMDENIIP
jgi:hypothetical protein